MSLLDLLFRRKQKEVFEPDPGETREMPARPYKVLHADLSFYSDPDCRNEVKGGRLLVLQCEDPKQKHKVVECMPAMKSYSQGQIVQWELNNKQIWEAAWYVHPDTGRKDKAWNRAVEFVGRVVKV
jgi:hypothetical protein